MSHNYKLADISNPAQVAERPRCSVPIARLYVCKEGQPEAFQNTGKPADRDRLAATRALVMERFGPRTADAPKGLNCERYILAALERWITVTCRTEDSRRCYADRMWAWVAFSGRRSLSAQTDTPARAVADWLYALESQGRSARTIVCYRETLRSWFTWLFERDLVRRSPVTRDVRRLHRIDRGAVCKANGRRQALTPGEARRTATWSLRTAPAVAGFAVLLQLTAGLRSQEVAQLERRHLVCRMVEDGERSVEVWTLTVPGKGQRTRSVRLEPVAVAAWRRYAQAGRLQGERGPLLRAPGGGHYDRRSIQRWAKSAAAVVGRRLEISSHDLRHTAATQLLEHGARMDEVQALLGHASIETTKTCYIVDARPMRTTTGITAETEAS